MSFNLQDYETVDERIHKFWDKHPNGRIFIAEPIIIRSVEGAPLQYVFRCEVYRDATDALPASVGHAEETVGSTAVNRTAALENGETSAIGRALANLGFSAKGARPSQTEMAKVQRADAVPPSQRVVSAPADNQPKLGNPHAAPSEKQMMALINKTNKSGMTSDFYNQFWQFVLAGGVMNGDAEITKGEASKLIGMDAQDWQGYTASFFSALIEDGVKEPILDAPF